MLGNGNVSHSVVSNFLRPHGLQPARLLHPWNSSGKNSGVGYISFSRDSSQPRYWTWVSCIASRFLTVWATGEAPGTISVHSVHWFFHSSNHLWARCFYNPHFVDEEECTGKLNNFLWITQLQSETESEPRNLAPEPTCWSLFLVIWLWLSPTEISAKVYRTAKEQLDRGPRGPQLQPWL